MFKMFTEIDNFNISSREKIRKKNVDLDVREYFL